MELEPKIEDEPCLPDKKSGKVDHLTETIGRFGPFHAMIYTTMGLSIIIHNWQMFSNKFYTHKTNFWCAKPESHSDLEVSKWLNLSSPLMLMNNEYKFDRCSWFDIGWGTFQPRTFQPGQSEVEMSGVEMSLFHLGLKSPGLKCTFSTWG